MQPQSLHVEPFTSQRLCLSSSVSCFRDRRGFIVVSKALKSKVANDPPIHGNGIPVSTSNSVEITWQTEASDPSLWMTLLLSCTCGQRPLV